MGFEQIAQRDLFALLGIESYSWRRDGDTAGNSRCGRLPCA